MPEEDLLRALYAAFNARDIAAASDALAADVDWPNAMEGGRLRGRADVRAYWTRQFGLIRSHVEPLGMATEAGGRVRVKVRQIVRGPDGTLRSDTLVAHLYTFKDGAISAMEIETP